MKIIINNKKIEAKKGQTILEVAQKNKIDIPSLCFHSDLDIKSNCRLCVVEIKGKDGLHTACSTMIEQGMKIITESKKNSQSEKNKLRINFCPTLRRMQRLYLEF